MYGGVPVARLKLVSIRREALSALVKDRSYGNAELRREGGLWRDVDEFVALFSKRRWGDAYRIEFRNLERLANGKARSSSVPTATRRPRSGAELQLWQRAQWDEIARESARTRRGRR
jgi:hypothetical protein